MIAVFGLGLALSLAPSYSLAAGDDLQQAIEQTQQAINAGEQRDASSLVEAADNAIDHAVTADKQNANSHIKAGIKHLRKAIRTAKGTHSARRVAAAGKHAKMALTEFQSVK